MLNPVVGNPAMEDLRQRANVRLLNTPIPPMNQEARDLDVIAVREYLWSYTHSLATQSSLVDQPEVHRSIEAALTHGGHMILCLNEAERNGMKDLYERSLEECTDWQKVLETRDSLVYK